jgi:inosine-uridine nucleoside N-ribohydrolase
MSAGAPVPVILDTDIGGDIDDTWALVQLLHSPELDVRLIVTATADTVYRAKITAKLLESAGRTEIPLGLGVRQPSDGPRERQREWVSDYELAAYPGRVFDDGVEAMAGMLRDAAEPLTVICIGPLTNIAELLRRAPELAPRTRLVAMAGSLAVHHTTNLTLSVVPGRIAEFNVVMDTPAAQAVFRAPWREMVLTPLDSCAYVVIDGDRYASLQSAHTAVLQAVFENYRIWHGHCPGALPDQQTTVLYDTVAVHLAHTTRYLAMQTLALTVDDQGVTRETADGRPMQVAVGWTDLDGYLEELTARLLGEDIPSASCKRNDPADSIEL